MRSSVEAWPAALSSAALEQAESASAAAAQIAAVIHLRMALPPWSAAQVIGRFLAPLSAKWTMSPNWTAIAPILMLIASNVFMTFAWYGHLKVEHRPLWIIVMVSWGIAFFEYCFQVPANRIGHIGGLSGGQLKVIQEVITLVVFAVFARWYLGERLMWNHYLAFALIVAAVLFVFTKWS